MKAFRTHTPLIVLLAMTLAALSSFSAECRADETTPWKLKTGVILLNSDDPFAVTAPSGGRIHAGGNAELGIGVALEYRLSSLIGLELATVYAKTPDVDYDATGSNDTIGEGPGFLPLMAGANFHLRDTANLDLYVGPRIAYVNFGNFELDIDGQSTAFDVADEFAWGATAGLNYRFGNSRWSFVAEATHLDVDMEITERETHETTVNSFDPLMVNLGVSYGF